MLANSSLISVTLEVFQEERLPIDQVVARKPAPSNISYMFVTLEVFQEERSRVKEVAL